MRNVAEVELIIRLSLMELNCGGENWSEDFFRLTGFFSVS